MRRTPSAASAGTIRREPALESPEVPASTKTVMVLVRIKWHAPPPTAIDSTNTSPRPGDCANGRNGPSHKPTIKDIVTNQPKILDVWGVAIHADTHAIKATIVHHTSGRPVHQVPPGAEAAMVAVAPRVAAQVVATAPHK